MLFSLKQLRGRKGEQMREVIDLFGFYMFPQVRGEEPENLDTLDLEESIPIDGLMTPPLVCVFDWVGFCEYVALTNTIHKSSINPRDFSANCGKSRWLVLCYGHRRVVACRRLHERFEDSWIKGCQTDVGQKSLALLKLGKIEADFICNPPASVAKRRQLDENRHRGVDSAKEARVIAEMFLVISAESAGMTAARFARESGINEDRVREAVWFYNLPSLVQEAVAKKVIEYGHAVQIGRYLERVKPEDPSDKALELLGKVISDQPNVSEFSKWTSLRIEEAFNAHTQLNMAELMSAEAVSSRDKVRQRMHESTGKTVEKSLLLVNGWQFLCHQRIIALTDSPFLDGKNANQVSQTALVMLEIFREFERLAEILPEPINPHLRRLISMIRKAQEKGMNMDLQEFADLAGELAEMLKEEVAR